MTKTEQYGRTKEKRDRLESQWKLDFAVAAVILMVAYLMRSILPVAVGAVGVLLIQGLYHLQASLTCQDKMDRLHRLIREEQRVHEFINSRF